MEDISFKKNNSLLFFNNPNTTQGLLQQLQQQIQLQQQYLQAQQAEQQSNERLLYQEYKALLDVLSQLDSETRKRFRRKLGLINEKVGKYMRNKSLRCMLSAYRAIIRLKHKANKRLLFNKSQRYSNRETSIAKRYRPHTTKIFKMLLRL